MFDKKYKKDIAQLEKIAYQQNKKINLSTILITLKCDQDDLQEILCFFTEKDIEIINEDVEPDSYIEDETSIDRNISPFDPSKIDIKMDKITVDSIIKRIINEELELDSSFQRRIGLWNKQQKSQLIESLFLKIPLPAFYFDASDDDSWQIIDGLQRIGTIKEYVIDQGFALTGMEFLKDLNGLTFDKLPRALQRRIEESNLNAYLVNPSTPKNVKFNIFKRINTGGLILEAQEIRNALFQGQATEFLLELANIKAFAEATCHSIKTDRMLDREFCLRYVTFTNLDMDTYNGTLDDFLNQGMEFLTKTSKEKLEEIKDSFEKTMNNCEKIFGRFAFRRLNTEERRGPVNKALFEGWSVIISELKDEKIEKLIQERGLLFEKFTQLCDDYSFQNLLRASDKNSIKTRIKRIQKMVNQIVDEEKNV